ncbi:hypothetical protein BDW42DRAFT_175466 [Aspergillus taichungensis]|uniref:Uncharacterized protein n=1 Tax=Aspergillus taichungensis TaxID=482145 RepID=A0A2J5HLU6_9EURO|nr:hypothetical protein BDW42DRAFT_175466 [Aspergillus taichungensis]
MGYSDLDQLAINTIRLLAVCYHLSLFLPLSRSLSLALFFTSFFPFFPRKLSPLRGRTPRSHTGASLLYRPCSFLRNTSLPLPSLPLDRKNRGKSNINPYL